jgi:CheY-like chemotaxis protein
VVPLFGSQSLHVLVVDDNTDAAETLAGVLRIAFGGAAAQLAFERKLRSLVVLDTGLPDMNGEELARHIRRYPQRKSVRIVALTGLGTERYRERSREAGVDFHLLKPVDPDALLQILSQPIARKAELHSMKANAAEVGASEHANDLQT